MPVTVREVSSTLCFVGIPEYPLQVVQVRLTGLAGAAGPVSVRVDADPTNGSTDRPTPVVLEPGGPDERVVEVGTDAHRRHPPGSPIPVIVTVTEGADRHTRRATVEAAEPGWTMWMVPHFHYDPVWWNTQAAYTQRWDDLSGAQASRSGYQQTAFSLVRAYLDAARQDPDYRFVLAEVDYLKPYWDCFPQDRAYLRRLVAEGRLEIVGGTYNEPNTNLTSPESTARNAVHGLGFTRHVLGADPDTAWQLDVFGHDPQFPGMMRDAGLTTSSWARGPFHQWGPILNPGGEPRDPRRMQFPSEFRWISPGGGGLVTAYMADHYSIGYWMDSAPTLADAEAEVYRIFSELRLVAATRNVLLPVGTDHAMPNRWVTEIARDWSARYLWPRFVCATPRQFFTAVRAESNDGAALWPQTRDMNPVYTGKDVSYIDVKQAQRAAENTLVDAEKFATLACLFTGASYPDAQIDRAWRQLVFGAHHDGITGTFSDQVYLDLLAGWLEAYDLARNVHDQALDTLASVVDTRSSDPTVRALVVFNALSWPRTDLVTTRVTFDRPGVGSVTVHHSLDEPGEPVVAEAVTRHADGSLAGATLTFLARDVPGLGHRTYWLRGSATPLAVWTPTPGTSVVSDRFAVTVDPERGGGITSLVDRATGRELIRAGQVGNEFRLHDEYSAHPRFGEGPWHLLPTGAVRGSADVPARVRIETSPVGQRVTATGRLGSLTYTTTILLAEGTGRADISTTVDGFAGADQLLRMRVPANLPGALPVSEVGYAVVGRGYGLPDVDAAQAPWTLDNPAHTWFGLGSTARVRIGAHLRAVGVAEVVVPEPVASGGGADGLVTALARVGVTSTCSTPERERYGALDVDSNLPDVRLSVGGPQANRFTAQVLAEADPGYARELARQLAGAGTARVWVPADRPLRTVWQPNADLRGARDLPVLVVAGADEETTRAAVAALVEDLADACVEVTQDPALPVTPAAVAPAVVVPAADAAEPSAADHTVAVLNRGLPGFAVDPSGALHLSLFRSCTGWPSGVWIDPPRRSTPDGSGFQLQHWSHTFDYALVSGPGDWRQAGMVHHGQSYNHPLVARPTDQHPGPLAPCATLLAVHPDTALLAALKPAGNPLARGSTRVPDPADQVALRLYEAHGRSARATFDGLVGLTELTRADLVESPLGPEGDGVSLAGAEVVTVLAHPAGLPAPAGPAVGPAAHQATDVDPPVFARYWLHNTGPAPIGNLPLAVHLHPGEVSPVGPAADPTTLRVTVASDLTAEPQHALVRVVLPDGWRAEPAERPVSLAPGGFAEYEVAVYPPPGLREGSYLVLVRAAGADGRLVEDAATVHVGAPRHRFGTEVTVGLDVRGVVVEPGGHAEIPVVLRNRFGSRVGGQAHLITPWGTWDLVGTTSLPFTLEPGQTGLLSFAVAAPADAPTGSYWALVRVTYAGRVAYTETVPFEVVARR